MPAPATRRRPTPEPIRVLPNPTFDDLYAPFADQADRPTVEFLEPRELPEPYRGLLVHNHHMTVTVETFYGDSVDVRPVQVAHAGDDYARKIVLTLRGSGRVVQFGVVRVDLAKLAPAVRDEIVSERTPLGRVLIDHGVLRTVRPTAFYRADPAPPLCEWLGLSEPATLYGRLGVLTVDGEPAIEVAEILAPAPH